MRHKHMKYFVIAATFAAGIAVPGFTQSAQTPTQAPAQPAALKALAQLQPGQWELRPRGAGTQKSLCLNDMKALLQVQHAGAVCTRFVITNVARQATVNYSCARGGTGQTTVKVETPRLVQLQTQGIVDNEPFAYEYEGRRVGACAVNSGALLRSQGSVVKGKLTFRD